MSFKSLFLPDNKKFFLLFDKVADNLQQMSGLLLDAVRHNNGELDNYIARLNELENANDLITHKLFIELGKNFITPFDREDIHYLASGLDDIADDMLGVAKQMRSHRINTSTNITITIAEYNQQVINMLSSILLKLRNTRTLDTLSVKCNEIKTVLSLGNNQIDKAAQSLFLQNAGTVDVIRNMDHYEKLQQLLNRTGNAVNVIESVIIKYG